MEQLREHEFGFTTDRLGFPRVQACRAIVYQNTNGLFGYHNHGANAPSEWDARAQQFADFVRSHPRGGGGGLGLYVVTFVTNHGGYAPGSGLRDWKGEAASFAAKLEFTGPRFGVNLSVLYKTGSAYVEVRPTGGLCTVHVQDWRESDVHGTQPYAASEHHKLNPASPQRHARPPFISQMNTTRLQQVSYETLL